MAEEITASWEAGKGRLIRDVCFPIDAVEGEALGRLYNRIREALRV